MIDRHRRVFNTDYIDSLLIHCMVKNGWTGEWKRIMDGFEEAKAKKWIRAKGVSCHSLPAPADRCGLRLAGGAPGARQPAGQARGRPGEDWNKPGHDIAPSCEQLKTMQAKGHGVIGMKLVGDGDFQNARGS